MKTRALLLMMVSVLLIGQAHSQTIYKANGIKVMKGMAVDSDGDGDFDGFTFLIKTKKGSSLRVSSIQVEGIDEDFISHSRQNPSGKWTSYYVDISSVDVFEEFLVRLEITETAGGLFNTSSYAIPGSPGGPGGGGGPTVVVIKYP